MAENSKIEWCDHTFNPWIGCTKVSEGCQHCYAEQMMDKRYGKVKWGPQGVRVRTSAANWKKPLAWNRKAKKEGRRYRVFCASLADVFEDKPDQPEMDEWRYHLLHLIGLTDNLDWLLLTKRPENVQRLIDQAHDEEGNKWSNGVGRWSGQLPPNVWIGTSVENQEQADIRIPELLKIPAAVRFLSMEPLLGPVNLSVVSIIVQYKGPEGQWDYTRPGKKSHIDWVIVGGESGPDARPMHPDWARDIRDRCVAAGVPFFFKQWGEWVWWLEGNVTSIRKENAFIFDDEYQTVMARVGKKAAGRLLDGRTWDELPAGESRLRK